MFVVLNEYRGLIVEVRVSYRKESVVAHLSSRITHISHHRHQCLVNHRDRVLADNDTFQIIRLHLSEPFVRSDIFDGESRLRVRVEDLFD